MRNGITWFESRKTWKAKIGFRRSDSGGRTERVFYFGADKTSALAQAGIIRAQWQALKLKGAEAWPEGLPDLEAIRAAFSLPEASGTTQTLRNAGRVPKATRANVEASAAELVAPDALTVEQAAKLYSQARTSTMSTRWARDTRQRLKAAVEALNKDRPLRELGQAELETFVRHWQGRPFKHTQKGGLSKTERVSYLYAKHIVAASKSFLEYCYEHQDILWDKPRAFDRIMRIKNLSPVSTSFDEDEDKHYSVEQIRKLYAAADPLTKAYILVALNCAYYPVDLEDLRPEHIVEVDERIYLRNRRKKTGVKRSHLLWASTARALKENLDSFGKGFNADYFQKTWRKLRESVGIEDVLFKHFRHTSSHMVKELSDAENSAVHRANTGNIPTEHLDGSGTKEGLTPKDRVLSRCYGEKLSHGLGPIHRYCDTLWTSKDSKMIQELTAKFGEHPSGYVPGE